MNSLAGALDDMLNPEHAKSADVPRKYGFALLIYPPHQSRINYIGNGNRSDMLVALKELVARWEGRVPTVETPQ